MSDTGIVIVTYNSGAEIGACLDAALPSGAEIVVVDNGSHDGTIAEIASRSARLIGEPAQSGFRRGGESGFAAL